VIREVILGDAILRTEELIRFLTHHPGVDVWKSPMLFDKFLCTEGPPPWNRTQLGDHDSIAGEVVGLTCLDRVHDGSGVVSQLSLGDDLHGLSVAPRSATCYEHLGRCQRG
jgi:hypothetical protein